MLCLSDGICHADACVQQGRHAVEEAQTLTELLLAAWSLACLVALHVVEAVLAERARRPTSWPLCPTCGKRLRSKGFVKREVMSRLGLIQWQRRVGRCPQGCDIGHGAPSPAGSSVGRTSHRQDSRSPGRKPTNGRNGLNSEPRPTLDAAQSALARDRLFQEIDGIASADLAEAWARDALLTKNTLVATDATRVEEAFEQKLAALASTEVSGATLHGATESVSTGTADQGVRDQGELAISKPRRYRSTSFRRSDDRNDLEVGDVVPVCHPLIKQATIATFHNLEAAAQVLGDPTSPILDPYWHQTSAISEPPVHRNRIPAPKVLDHHIQHGCSAWRFDGTAV